MLQHYWGTVLLPHSVFTVVPCMFFHQMWLEGLHVAQQSWHKTLLSYWYMFKHYRVHPLLASAAQPVTAGAVIQLWVLTLCALQTCMAAGETAKLLSGVSADIHHCRFHSVVNGAAPSSCSSKTALTVGNHNHTITMRYLYSAPYKIGQWHWTRKKLIKTGNWQHLKSWAHGQELICCGFECGCHCMKLFVSRHLLIPVPAV